MTPTRITPLSRNSLSLRGCDVASIKSEGVRSLSNVADVGLLGDVTVPLDSSAALAGFESESAAYDDDDTEHRNSEHPEVNWSTVTL